MVVDFFALLCTVLICADVEMCDEIKATALNSTVEQKRPPIHTYLKPGGQNLSKSPLG